MRMLTDCRSSSSAAAADPASGNSGDVLTPEQAKLLKLSDIKLSTFHLRLRCVYEKDTGSFEHLATSDIPLPSILALEAAGGASSSSSAAAAAAAAGGSDGEDDDGGMDD